MKNLIFTVCCLFMTSFVSANSKSDHTRVQMTFDESFELIEKYSSRDLNLNARQLSTREELRDTAILLKNALQNVMLVVLFPRLETCRHLANDCYEVTANEVNKADLLIAQLRNIYLDNIIDRFDSIEHF